MIDFGQGRRARLLRLPTRLDVFEDVERLLLVVAGRGGHVECWLRVVALERGNLRLGGGCGGRGLPDCTRRFIRLSLVDEQLLSFGLDVFQCFFVFLFLGKFLPFVLRLPFSPLLLQSFEQGWHLRLILSALADSTWLCASSRLNFCSFKLLRLRKSWRRRGDWARRYHRSLLCCHLLSLRLCLRLLLLSSSLVHDVLVMKDGVGELLLEDVFI